MKKILSFIKKIYSTISLTVSKNELISLLAIFSFFFVIFTLIYLRLNVLSTGDDHYFHIRFAQELSHGGFFEHFKNFQNLYFTKIAEGQHFLYYNFLFYLLLIPFTKITPLFLGIKLYAIFGISVIGTGLYLIIKKIGFKYPFFWALSFFAIVGNPSLLRFFAARPFVLAPIIILFLIYSFYRKNYKLSFIISFLYLFWHTATFILPICLALLYFVIYALYYKKYDFKLILYPLLGALSAVLTVFLINKGFFISIHENIIEVIKGVSVDKSVNIAEGGEVYARNIFDLFTQNTILIVLFISTSIYHLALFSKERINIDNINEQIKKTRTLSMVLFFCSAIFFLAVHYISYRFADFFMFFAWFFIVMILSTIASSINITDFFTKKIIRLILGVSVLLLFLNNLFVLNDSLPYGNRPLSFTKVGEYINSNLKEGDLVFNMSWDWFPQLYYHAPKQNYVIGLEPKLTYAYDEKIYWVWRNIGKAIICSKEKCPNEEAEKNYFLRKKDRLPFWYKNQGDQIAKIIKYNFKSNYIVSSKDYEYINNIMDNNKNFEKVVDDKEFGYMVYKIK